jgi:hypothetical protein
MAFFEPNSERGVRRVVNDECGDKHMSWFVWRSGTGEPPAAEASC